MQESAERYVALVGRPNVGKSTLFNRLTRTREAIVHDEPGVTRDRHYGRVELEEGSFTLIDTGGFEPTAEEGLPQLMRAQVETAVAEADVVIFILDGRQGVTPMDMEIAGLLRKRSKKVVAAINKLDDPRMYDQVTDFYSLGLDNLIPVSSEHGLGVSPLLEAVTELLPPGGIEAEPPEGVIRLAVVGRPNVGKSSLINKVLGQERMVVSDVPGTTRDAVDTPVKVNGRDYLLMDTAGIRKPGRIKKGVERWSVVRAMKTMDRADVALVLIDAVEGLTDQEARVCGLALERGRAVILAVNKWDLMEDPDRSFKEFKDLIAYKLKFLSYVPWLVISAKNGRNMQKIFKAAEEIYAQYTYRASTSEVNRVLEESVRHHQAPIIGRGRLKLFYATQVSTRPPTFVVFTNAPDKVHFSYSRYLQNRFREAFGLDRIPVKIHFRKRTRRD